MALFDDLRALGACLEGAAHAGSFGTLAGFWRDTHHNGYRAWLLGRCAVTPAQQVEVLSLVKDIIREAVNGNWNSGFGADWCSQVEDDLSVPLDNGQMDGPYFHDVLFDLDAGRARYPNYTVVRELILRHFPEPLPLPIPSEDVEAVNV